MKRILTNKAGVTILEGVIALGLLALVAGGAFGVLLSASRQTTQPDIREEMTWAVEKAHDQLKAYLGSLGSFDLQDISTEHLPADLQDGLCGGDSSPLREGNPHDIECKLPPICDKNNDSDFSYRIEQADYAYPGEDTAVQFYRLTFSIKCNGYKL